MHFINLSLPSSVAPGIARSAELGVEIVATVGGGEVRNQLWDEPLRTYEVPFPVMKRTATDFAAIKDLWATVAGEVHSFEHYDEIDDETVWVRFDGELKATHVAGPYWQFETLMLREVRREDD